MTMRSGTHPPIDAAVTSASRRNTSINGHVDNVRTADDTAQEPHHDEILVTIPHKRLIQILLALAGLLAIAHLLVSLNRYRLNIVFFAADNLYVVFDMWGEVSIPSWFSIALLLACAGLLGVIAVGKRARNDRFTRHWTVLALIFLALSMMMRPTSTGRRPTASRRRLRQVERSPTPGSYLA